MIPRYSQRALKAIVYLFSPYNDIEVYVEDDLNRNMYEIVIERILQDKAKVKRIFPLSGRNEVIKACEKDQDDSRQRIYIIDGDMDLLIGKEKPELKYLYRLGVYTSENLLISEQAAIEISYEDISNEEKTEIQKSLDLSGLIEEAVEKLTPLFVMYAVKHLLETRDSKHIHIETSKYKVERLGEDCPEGICLSETKIKKKILEIRHLLNKEYGYTEKEIESAITEVLTNFPSEDSQLSKYISAKTYLLPLIFHRLKKKS